MLPIQEGVNEAYLPPRARMKNLVVDGPLHQKQAPGMIAGRPPYLVLSSRPDILVFQTPPLDAPLEVTGPILVKLWVSSSAPDTDITVKLLDIYPPSEDYSDGYHLNLVDTILRLRYRDSFEQETLMTPGEIYPIQIALPPTSNLFAAGHRIRLDISSSNFPRFDLNPNTGEAMGRHTHSVAAQNTVYFDPATRRRWCCRSFPAEMSILDLRSDVLTPPTEAMWAAMHAAEVGWALFGEDDNVARLEALGASMLGKPACLFVPTCGMANLVAMMSLGERGTRVVFERRSHMATSEAAGFAYVCGLLGHPLDTADGVLDEASVEAAMSEADPARASLLVLENTHTRAGGVPMTVARTAGLAASARRHGAAVHLDGARLLNAAAALDVEPHALTEPVDSVALSLNKGAGAPMGALLAGSVAVIEHARLNLRRLGGASIHQAGLFASAGIVALDSGLSTAREDNAAAAELAELLVSVPRLAVDTLAIRTNIVTVDVSQLGLEAAAFVALLKARDIRAFPRGPTHVRFVTHRGIRRAEVLAVVDAIMQICGCRAFTISI